MRELSNVTSAISGGDARLMRSPPPCCATELLPRHRDADGFLRRDEVIDAFSILGDGQLNALHATRKAIPARTVVR